MGKQYSIICENKNCKYHKILLEGPGMIEFKKMMEFSKNPSNAKKIKKGAKITTNGIYLCPKCKEIQTNNKYFLLENFTLSPYGPDCFDVTFPFGKPVCEKCDSELIHIKNFNPSEIKCPKCGDKLKTEWFGYRD